MKSKIGKNDISIIKGEKDEVIVFEGMTDMLSFVELLKANNQKNRIFTAVDMFPTTLASLGVEIEGNRLALGTNLFSDEQTLAEKLTYETLLEELKKKSPFYSRYIMQGTDIKLLYEDTK